MWLSFLSGNMRLGGLGFQDLFPYLQFARVFK